MIRNDKEFEVAGTDETEQKANRQALTDALKALQDALQPKSGDSRKATPFYALLLMDGDNMGKLLSVYKDKQGDISAALAQFSQAVRGIVRDHNGRLIYAGGDDVFALLPLDKAIECAKNCRDTYKKYSTTDSKLSEKLTLKVSQRKKRLPSPPPLSTPTCRPPWAWWSKMRIGSWTEWPRTVAGAMGWPAGCGSAAGQC